jgi:CubicO group peptidase (beta-lactamase class C family)
MGVNGFVDDRLDGVARRLEDALASDPDYSFQAVALRNGERVLDVWGGPHLGEHSVFVPFSVTKVTVGVVIGLLVERSQLDLDAAVAGYWPEFGTSGKAGVTVRQLLSHQAGLPQVSPPFAWAELLDDHAASARLADAVPWWHPGSAFGYHAVTIGNLASELVFRITGLTLQQYYEREIRAPHGVDFYLGLPEAEAHRRVPVLPILPPADAGPGPFPSVIGPAVLDHSGPSIDFANDPASWRFGHPAGSGAGSARGVARLLALAVTGVEGGEPLLSSRTVDVIGQQQVHGFDEVLGQHDRAHAIVFQKPTPRYRFGGPRAFGHDGAQGCFAMADPDSGLTFAYLVARGPWPGGADPLAVSISAEIAEVLLAAAA